MPDKHKSILPVELNRLDAYQHATRLAHTTYSVTSKFPKRESRLVKRMRAAAVGVFTEIAEGYGRERQRDFLRHTRYAKGFLFELGSMIEFSEGELEVDQNVNRVYRNQFEKTREAVDCLIDILDGADDDEDESNTRSAVLNGKGSNEAVIEFINELQNPRDTDDDDDDDDD